MDKILEISKEAIVRYFTTLSQFGYKKYSDVNKLIFLISIEELLTGELSYFIDEKDYNSIINALYCQFGSTCLIDFPIFDVYDTLIHYTKGNLIPRITEDSILRVTQDENLRVIE